EYIFFFQAEDGIRDFHVTGVQTCALPILLQPRFARLAAALTRTCAGAATAAPLDSARLAALAGETGSTAVAAGALPQPEVIRSTLAPWLFGAALAFALAALLLQRRTAGRTVPLEMGRGE